MAGLRRRRAVTVAAGDGFSAALLEPPPEPAIAPATRCWGGGEESNGGGGGGNSDGSGGGDGGVGAGGNDGLPPRELWTWGLGVYGQLGLGAWQRPGGGTGDGGGSGGAAAAATVVACCCAPRRVRFLPHGGDDTSDDDDDNGDNGDETYDHGDDARGGDLRIGGARGAWSPVARSPRPAWVCCGAGHSACVAEGGLLFTWGSGGRGQLGHGSKLADKWAPALVRGARAAERGRGFENSQPTANIQHLLATKHYSSTTTSTTTTTTTTTPPPPPPLTHWWPRPRRRGDAAARQHLEWHRPACGLARRLNCRVRGPRPRRRAAIGGVRGVAHGGGGDRRGPVRLGLGPLGTAQPGAAHAVHAARAVIDGPAPVERGRRHEQRWRCSRYGRRRCRRPVAHAAARVPAP